MPPEMTSTAVRPDRVVNTTRYKTSIYQELPRPRSSQDGVALFHGVSATRDLKSVRSPIGLGLYASGDILYAGASFMRDSTEGAQHLLPFEKSVARDTIHAAVEFQAQANHSASDAKFGAIHHEHRSLWLIQSIPDLKPEVEEKAREKLAWLGPRWGGSETEMTYYGAYDTPEGFVRLVADYKEMYPDDYIERDVVIRQNGESVTVAEGRRDALKWIKNEVIDSDLGLVEFGMQNPQGIQNKYWKDSASSLIHINGEKANHKSSIAEIGIQGLTYDAFKKSARTMAQEEIDEVVSMDEVRMVLEKPKVKALFTANEIESMLTTWNQFDILAKVVQKQTFHTMWMPDQKFFASGIDRDPVDGTERQIATIGSNPAALLEMEIFDDLPLSQKRLYVGSIVSTVLGPNLLTDIGIRGRSLEHLGLVTFSDYHGVEAVWGKETENIRRGLKKQGFYGLAEQLRIRLLNADNISGETYEFRYVDAEGRVAFDPHGKYDSLLDEGAEIIVFAGTNIPEGKQAWQITSHYAAKREKETDRRAEEHTWQAHLENTLLEQMPTATLLKTKEELAAAFPRNYRVTIDLDKGIEGDKHYNTSYWDTMAA